MELEFKGTKDEWLIDCRKKAIYEYPNYLPIISNDYLLIALVNHKSGEINVHEYSANAELIVEAGNVANQTGLTPRQLLAQRDNILEALQKIKTMCDGNITNENNIWHIANKAIEKALK